MLHLPSHNGAFHASLLEGLNQLRQFAQRKPVHGARTVRFNLRKCLFLDRSHDDVIALPPRRIEHEEREFAVTGDQTEFLAFRRHGSNFVITLKSRAILSLALASFTLSLPRSSIVLTNHKGD